VILRVERKKMIDRLSERDTARGKSEFRPEGERELEKTEEVKSKGPGQNREIKKKNLGPVRSIGRSTRSKPGPDRRPKIEKDKIDDRTEEPRFGPVWSRLPRSLVQSSPGPFNEQP